MTELSPAAQAVMDAALEHSGPAFEPLVRKMVTDALRALAVRINGATPSARTSSTSPPSWRGRAADGRQSLVKRRA
jgi:hypothetical protein